MSGYGSSRYAEAASVSAGLMAGSLSRVDPEAIALYFDALRHAYGRDSVIAAAQRLMAVAPSPTTQRYLESK